LIASLKLTNDANSLIKASAIATKLKGFSMRSKMKMSKLKK